MKNPFCAYSAWRRAKSERALARGGWHLFWFCMTAGLWWSLWVFAITSVYGFLSGDTFKYLSLQNRLFINFVGGMLFGFITWLLHLSRRPSRPAPWR